MTQGLVLVVSVGTRKSLHYAQCSLTHSLCIHVIARRKCVASFKAGMKCLTVVGIIPENICHVNPSKRKCKNSRFVKLTTLLHLEPRLGMPGAIPPLALCLNVSTIH
jgi:hypothetical protein